MSIALVDCVSFYASCERVFRPDLKERPVVVLSNNGGCVIARSVEAKKMGIKMGVPWALGGMCVTDTFGLRLRDGMLT